MAKKQSQNKQVAQKKSRVVHSDKRTVTTEPDPANKQNKHTAGSKKFQSLAGPVTLTKDTFRLVWNNKKMWIGIMLVYIILQVILVQGILGGDVRQFVDDFQSLYDGVSSSEQRLAVLTYILMTTGKATTSTGALLQAISTIIVTLALLWGLRQSAAESAIRIRDTFYNGMYPLIPFVLVLFVVLLQILPFAIGASLFQATVGSGVAVGILEQLFWIVIVVLLVLLTIYWLCASLIALYVVTLPNKTPILALRSASKLVRHRRMAIFVRVLLFALMLFVGTAFLVVPLIFVAPFIATWVFYIAGVVGYGLFVTYVYCLYRGLLDES